MGNPLGEPANRPPVRADTPWGAEHRRRETRLDRLCNFVDWVVSRALAVATVVAILKGQVTPAMVMAVYLILRLLGSTRPSQ